MRKWMLNIITLLPAKNPVWHTNAWIDKKLPGSTQVQSEIFDILLTTAVETRKWMLNIITLLPAKNPVRHRNAWIDKKLPGPIWDIWHPWPTKCYGPCDFEMGCMRLTNKKCKHLNRVVGTRNFYWIWIWRTLRWRKYTTPSTKIPLHLMMQEGTWPK